MDPDGGTRWGGGSRHLHRRGLLEVVCLVLVRSPLASKKSAPAVGMELTERNAGGAWQVGEGGDLARDTARVGF
ncbi:hypothetical protein [Streptomyces sp. MH60]|uniref:hypothetical protein n=1 Tax=Streptomyces sp. MH60 TaxID=1940758 RepID=UPI000CEDA430|nr:hypothetical protein [Streptomyces sp. MH60]PPS90863.1 hypothetical protein BZZ08_00460 [Streptomyces sp. MH60]